MHKNPKRARNRGNFVEELEKLEFLPEKCKKSSSHSWASDRGSHEEVDPTDAMRDDRSLEGPFPSSGKCLTGYLLRDGHSSRCRAGLCSVVRWREGSFAAKGNFNMETPRSDT